MFTLLQLFGAASADYFEHTQAINQEYCNRHGYVYDARELPAEPDGDEYRSLYRRAPMALELLAPDNNVLYLDPDAYIVDLARTLEDIMDGYFQSENTAILMPNTGFDAKPIFPGVGVNTGVFLVRDLVLEDVHPARDMLQAWWDAYEPAKLAAPASLDDTQRFFALNNQELFNAKIFRKYQQHINVARNPEFGGTDGNFIRHQQLLPCVEREHRILRDRERLGL